MSALAMILTAAMVVPGDGREKVSGEVKQGLDLWGVWEGTWKNPQGGIFRIKLTQSECQLDLGESAGSFQNPITDEGNGKLRFRGSPGIYQQDGDRLLICFGVGGINQRPTSFRNGNEQYLLVLHRLKPRK